MANIKKHVLLIVISSCLTLQPVWAAPVMPFRIGGFLLVDGNQITPENKAAYTVTITRQDGTSFIIPQSASQVGVGKGFYLIDIPICNESGGIPGEPVILRVYRESSELTVISPAGGFLRVGESGTIREIPIEAESSPGVAGVD